MQRSRVVPTDDRHDIPNESPVMRETRRGRRRSHRFRPSLNLPGAVEALEPRRLLSHAAPEFFRHAHPAFRANGRIGPAVEIRKQYAAFYTAFQQVEASYVQSLNQQATGTVSVATTLTAPYLAGMATMQVADAGVFGPEGVFGTPVIATALVGSVPVGTFTITGSSGNQIALNTAQSSAVSLDSGTTLAAQVSSSATTSAGLIFPSYIVTSSQTLAINLVKYFNSLPIRLPRMYASPHYPQRAGALQQYVYQVVASGTAASLEQTLNSIPLPLTPGGDLRIYDAAVQAAIFASRQRMLNGVQQIFANKYPVIPVGYGGVTAGGTTGSTGTTGSSTSTGSPGATGGSSTGTTGAGTGASGVGSSGTNLSSTFVP